VASLPIMAERRAMWKRHNALQRVRPMILVFPEGSWGELLAQSALKCSDEKARRVEWQLRSRLYYHERLRDDMVIEREWVVGKAIKHTGWGLEPKNIPSTEAFVRHCLYGKRYFREHLGADVVTGWNVDSFGHAAGLPQILKKAGFTSYIFFRPTPPHERELPGPVFWWEGPDGSRIIACRPPAGEAGSSRSGMSSLASGGMVRRRRPIEGGGSRIRIGGVDDYIRGHAVLEPVLAETNESDLVVLAAHNPAFVKNITNNGIDLVLSGHTHGGQVTFFGLWAPFFHFKYGQRYRASVFEAANATVIVSNGVGTTYVPIRFFAEPEINVIELENEL